MDELEDLNIFEEKEFVALLVGGTVPEREDEKAIRIDLALGSGASHKSDALGGEETLAELMGGSSAVEAEVEGRNFDLLAELNVDFVQIIRHLDLEHGQFAHGTEGAACERATYSLLWTKALLEVGRAQAVAGTRQTFNRVVAQAALEGAWDAKFRVDVVVLAIGTETLTVFQVPIASTSLAYVTWGVAGLAILVTKLAALLGLIVVISGWAGAKRCVLSHVGTGLTLGRA